MSTIGGGPQRICKPNPPDDQGSALSGRAINGAAAEAARRAPGASLLGPGSAGCRPPPCRAWAPGRNPRPSGPKPSVVCGPASACRLRRRSASAFCAGRLRPAPLPRGVPPAAAAARAARSRAPGPGPPRGLPLAPASVRCGLPVRAPLLPPSVACGCVPGLRCLRPGRGLPPAPVGALRSAPGGAAGAALRSAPVFSPRPPGALRSGLRWCGARLGFSLRPSRPRRPAGAPGKREASGLGAAPRRSGPRFSRPCRGSPAALRAALQRFFGGLTNRKL